MLSAGATRTWPKPRACATPAVGPTTERSTNSIRAQGIPGANQCIERVHSEDRDRFLEAFDTMIRHKKDVEDDFRIAMPDGRVKYLHGIGHPVLMPKETYSKLWAPSWT